MERDYRDIDLETYSPTGVPRNVLRFANLERKYHPAEKRDKEVPRKKDFKGAPINHINGIGCPQDSGCHLEELE